MWAGDKDPNRRHGSVGRCIQYLEIKEADGEGNPVSIDQQGKIWEEVI